MSNIDNLGRYGEFSRNADEYIRQLQSDAVDDAALRQHAEGAAAAVVLGAAVVGCVKLSRYVATQYRSKSEERTLRTARTKAKLKEVMKKISEVRNSDDVVDESADPSRNSSDGGNEN